MVLHGIFNKETKMILNLSEKTINTIGAALQELPYKLVAEAIAEIGKQVNAEKERETVSYEEG